MRNEVTGYLQILNTLHAPEIQIFYMYVDCDYPGNNTILLSTPYNSITTSYKPTIV